LIKYKQSSLTRSKNKSCVSCVCITEFQVSDEIKSLIEAIDEEYKIDSKMRNISRKINEPKPVNFDSTYREIRPHIRIINYNPMIMTMEEEVEDKMRNPP